PVWAVGLRRYLPLVPGHEGVLRLPALRVRPLPVATTRLLAVIGHQGPAARRLGLLAGTGGTARGAGARGLRLGLGAPRGFGLAEDRRSRLGDVRCGLPGRVREMPRGGLGIRAAAVP